MDGTAETKVSVRLDLGCGKNKKKPEEGETTLWTGVDSRPFEGVDMVVDLTQRVHEGSCITHVGGDRCDCDANRRDAAVPFAPWPWADGSVDEVHSSHFVEHLDADERIHFVNEVYRILKPGGKATLIVPHWSSCRAYGDLTHKWPPVSEFWLFYLNKKWRDEQAPHNDQYTCNFDTTMGYSMRDELAVRNQEYVLFALTNFKDNMQDMITTLTKI